MSALVLVAVLSPSSTGRARTVEDQTRPPARQARSEVLSADDYVRLAQKSALVAMDKYWDAKLGYYVSPVQESSLTNIMMVQALGILAGLGELDDPYRERCTGLLDKLMSAPVYVDGEGVSLHMSTHVEPHISVAAPYCTALYYAWKYRGALELDRAAIRAIEERVTGQADWIGRRLFENRAGTNQTAARWGLEAACAAYKITGSDVYRENAQTYLGVFLANYATPRAGYKRSWLNSDWTWVYDPTFPRATSNERSEYSFTYLSHCGTGVVFYQDMNAPLDNAAKDVLNAVFQRTLGNWTVSGYPNWISAQLDQRTFSTDYWVWCFHSLIAMTRWQAWDADHRALSRAILDHSVALFDRMFLEDPHRIDDAFVANPYQVCIAETASLNRHSDLALSMYAAYLAMAVDLDVFAVTPAADPRVWGYEKDTRNLYVSTSCYAAASGNEILAAFYEDRGDITLLYHSNGRLLTPAYVQGGEDSAQWSLAVTTSAEGDSTGEGGPRTLYSEQTRPDEVVVCVDGQAVCPSDYDLTIYDMHFDCVEKTSIWRRPEYTATLELKCYPACILRSITVQPRQSARLECSSVFPSRNDLTGITAATADGQVVDVRGPAAAALDATSIKWLHFKWDGYGYVVIPLWRQLPSGYQGRIEICSPPPWEWDRGRGDCVVLRLSEKHELTEALRFAHLVGFSDGTDQDAERTYRRLLWWCISPGMWRVL